MGTSTLAAELLRQHIDLLIKPGSGAGSGGEATGARTLTNHMAQTPTVLFRREKLEHTADFTVAFIR